MITKIKNKLKSKALIGFSMFALTVLTVYGSALNANAQASTSPIEVVDAVVGSGINSVVQMVTSVVTNYFPYVIAFAVIATIFGWLRKHSTLGAK